MRNIPIILILVTLWLSSCQKRSKSVTGEVSIDSQQVDVVKVHETSAPPVHELDKYLYTDTLYVNEAGELLTIQNGLPKGGMIDPDGTPYQDASGKSYQFAVFWTRLVNESNEPIDIHVSTPADSFAIFTPPNSYLKLFLVPDEFSYQELSSFNYGLADIKSFLDINFNRGTDLQITLEANEDHIFYIATISYQAAGVPRGAFILKGNDLYYSMSLAPDGSGMVYCGGIEE